MMPCSVNLDSLVRLLLFPNIPRISLHCLQLRPLLEQMDDTVLRPVSASPTFPQEMESGHLESGPAGGTVS